jgi:ADP-ribose pyrophosphatase YjhB (NUDIX family)
VETQKGPGVAVGAVILVEEGPRPAVVLIQRARPPAQGSWTLPGGRVAHGERLEDALVREVREETGLEVEVVRLVEVVEILEPPHHYVVLDYLARLARPGGGTLVAGDDAADVRIVPVDELAAFSVTEAVARVVAAARG